MWRLASLGPCSNGILGHRVRLIPPQYVKPFVKRNKNDRADAEAMCEAAGRPGINFVPVVKQHTQLVNAVRGHAAEFGVCLLYTSPSPRDTR